MAIRLGARALASLFLIIPVAAFAAPPGSSGNSNKPSFSQGDANGDGSVSISEATKVGVSKREAKREDLNHDGKLTKMDWKFVQMSTHGSNKGNS